MPEINHHSQRVSALLGKPPGWLLRWGTGVIFGVVAALLVVATFVRYPDVISGTATVSSLNPPQVLQASKAGRMAMLLKADGDTVWPGDIIAVLEDATTLQAILILDSLVKALDVLQPEVDSVALFNWPQMAVGGLQNDYMVLQRAFLAYGNFVNQQLYENNIAAIQRQILMYGQYYDRSWQQRMVLQEQYDMAQGRYITDSTLAAGGVYDRYDLSQRKEALLQMEYSLHGARAALAQMQVQKAEMEKNLNELVLAFAREKTEKWNDFAQALQSARNGIQTWLTAHAFVAQTNGIVNYQTIWAKHQNVLAAQHVFTVIPLQKSEVKALVIVPPIRASKIIIGQHVQLKLAAYPFEEFGFLRGTVAKFNTSPTPMPDGNLGYVAEVVFEDGLTTTYGKPLQDFAELTGTAEIITEELSLLERVFYSLRKIFAG